MSDPFSETSRIRAVFVNSGARSLDEADERLSSLHITIALAPEAAETKAGQAAFLTAVATAARSFGRVNVMGALDAPMTLPLPFEQKTLGAAAVALGARISTAIEGARVISIGPCRLAAPWLMQACWDGWRASVRPCADHAITGDDNVLAGVAAGALAVGQAFFAECGDALAGKIAQGLSLWNPGGVDEIVAPRLRELALPAELWFIGLGNLGQASLWSLSVLPYSDPSHVRLVLQDDDSVDRDNWGTSILVRRGRYGALKTRIAEDWSLARGFRAHRIDRRVDEHERRRDGEPNVAIAGLDRMPARRLLGKTGFAYVIDAGLGANAQTFQRLRVNVFDKTLDPAVHFAGVEDQTQAQVENLLQAPAYQALAAEMQDGACGAAMLAEKSVAAPFVSAVAGALAVTQAIRLANGRAAFQTIIADLADLRSVSGALGTAPERAIVARTEAA